MDAGEKELRVLVITREPWCDHSNEGSVLSGWFQGQPFAVAQVYCKPGLPENSVCQRCFQMTDRMALESILRRVPMGRELTDTGNSPAQGGADREDRRFYDVFRRHNWEIFHLMRNVLWTAGGYKSEPLRRFVLDFAPDVIFAPLCYDRHVLDIQRWAAALCGAPMAAVIWDDLYSWGERRSPFFLVNRALLRRAVKKSAEASARLFTLCPQQAQAFSAMLGRAVAVLPKAAAPVERRAEAETPGAVRLIYGGGIYYGRAEVLRRVAQALQALQRNGVDCRLDIYTNSEAGGLGDGTVCFVHAAVPMEQLRERYAQSDIALHVEDFSGRNASVTRLSFSSKIADCLAGGGAVLAIGPADNAGIRYLQQQRAALCVTEPAGIAAAVDSLVRDAAARAGYRAAAQSCARREHDPVRVQRQLRQALEQMCGETGGCA